MKRQKNNIWFLILLVSLISGCSFVPSYEEFPEESINRGTGFEGTTKAKDETIRRDSIEKDPNTVISQKNPIIQPKPTFKKPNKKLYQTIEPPNPEKIISSYRVGKGDKISISVFGEEDFSVIAHLSKRGRISYPFLGELQLAGLTVNQIERQITAGLHGDYLVNPKVTVTVLEYRQLFVNGEVKMPGGYQFRPGMTVNKAISLAGGFTENASREELFIIRDGNQSGKRSFVILETLVGPGDIILVKEYKELFVNGEVKSPGGYQFKPDMTVNKAISLAGGFTENASREELFIIRDGNQSATQSFVTLEALVGPGDIILVKEYKKFFVNGEVSRPGSYQFIPNLTVEKAISMAGGFGEYATPKWSKIFVIRDEDKTQTPKRADLKTRVYPGDIITVEESTF